MTTASSSTSTPAPSTSKIALTPETLANMKIAKVYRQHNQDKKPFTSLCFDDKGELLITTGEDETLQLFNARTGKHQKQAFSKKYGCSLARFTHKSSTVIHASTKEDDTIRYLSLHDNTYIRYFKGHKRKVISLDMSPIEDTFLSGSTDDTVRLWDLRSPSCQGLLNIAGQPCVAFDPSGLVFAVALNLRQTVMLYDVRNFSDEPFIAKHIEDPVLSRIPGTRVPTFTSLKFSNDGGKLLVGTAGDVHYVLDSFNLDVVARLEGHQGLSRASPTFSSQETSWTPDSRSIISGSADGKLHLWDVQPPPSAVQIHASRPASGPSATWESGKVFEGHLGSPCRAVGFNPRLGMMASAGQELALWLVGSEPEKVEE